MAGNIKNNFIDIKKLFKPVVVSVLLVLTAVTGFADDAATSYNLELGTAMCVDNNEIRMNEEFVRLFQDGSVITDFYFENTGGNTVKIQLGFPIVGNPSIYGSDRFATNDGEDYEKKSEAEEKELIDKIFQFKTFIDGLPVKRTLVKADQETIDQFGYFYENYTEGGTISYFYVCELIFKPYEKHKVVNRYYQPRSNGGDSMGNGWSTLLYILRTGSTWKGTIGKCVVEYYDETHAGFFTQNDSWQGPFFTFNWNYFQVYGCSTGLSGLQPTQILNNGSTIIYRWEYEDFEPADDIAVTCFSIPSYLGNPSSISFDTYLFLALLLDSGIWDDFDREKMHLYFSDGIDTFYFWQQGEESADNYKENSNGNFIDLFNNIKPDQENHLEKIKENTDKLDLMLDTFANTFLTGRLPEKKSQYYTHYDEDIKLLSYVCRGLINYIYAKNGYIFKSDKWNQFFSQFEWYRGTTDGTPQFDGKAVKQIKLIQEFEKTLKNMK